MVGGGALLQLQGQTLTQAEYYSIGTSYLYKSCEVEGTAVLGGNQHTWDMANMDVLQDTIRIDIVDPSTAPQFSAYPQANVVERASDGTWVYTQQSASENRVLGFVASSPAFEIGYQQTQLTMYRPLNLYDTITGIYSHSYSASGYDFNGSGNTLITLDAWGSLILPNGQHDSVVRVKMVQHQSDTMVQWPNVSASSTTTYLWFDDTTASYLYSTLGLSISEQELSCTIYPNPASSFVRIALDASLLNLELRIQLMDSKGSVVLDERRFTDQAELSLDVPDGLPSGSYVIQLSSPRGTKSSIVQILQ
jgi:hypothetical protein